MPGSELYLQRYLCGDIISGAAIYCFGTSVKLLFKTNRDVWRISKDGKFDIFL